MTIPPKERGRSMMCACCGLPKEIYLDSPSAQQVCGDCKRHGPASEKVVPLHRDWWIAAAGQLVGAREKACSELKETSTRLAGSAATVMSDYHSAPLGALQQWVQSAAVADVEERSDQAYRSRDRVMAALWRVDALHRDDVRRRGHCSCGKRQYQCPEREALTPAIRILDTWEKKQLDRCFAGKTHGLPKTHPKVIERNGRVWRG